MIVFLALEKETVTVDKQYECMLFVIQAQDISWGYFPIYDRIYFRSLLLSFLTLYLLVFLFL